MVTEGLYPGGRKPFGYDVKTDKDGSKRLVRNRAEEAVLIQMKALKAEGVSMHKIAQRFGLPPRTVGQNPAENRPMNQGGPPFFCPQSGPALSSASSRRPDFRPPAATKRRASGTLFFCAPRRSRRRRI